MGTTFFGSGIVKLDGRKTRPMFRQIYDSVRSAILDGRLSKGFALPSSRELAVELGVSRMTVVSAYDQLTAEGYLTSAVGRGTFVSEELPEEHQLVRFGAPASRPIDEAPSDFGPYLSKTGQRYLHEQQSLPTFLSGSLKPFRPGIPALDKFPVETWAKLSRRRWKQATGGNLSYGHPAGYLQLRKSIAEYVQAFRGVRCDHSQVMVLSGTQQAIDVTSRLVLCPGDKVLFENPGYRTARAAIKTQGAEIVAMPIDENGALIAEGIRRAPNARMAYVTPSHQFPMGVTLSIERRMELIEWAQKNHSIIIEDDYDSEYRYAQRPIPSLQGLDRSERTVYIGSFSKVVFPALSIGYAVVPKGMVEAFETALAIVGRPPSILDQIILNDFIREGHFGRHLRRMRKVHQERRTAFVETIEELLGDQLEIVGSDAGLHCTARIRGGEDATEIARRITQKGVVIRDIGEYECQATPDEEHTNALIFGFACASPAKIRSAVRTIVDCF